MTSRKRRFRLLADWKLQGNFCLRICVYWLICQLALVATIIGFLTLAGQSDVGDVVDGSPWRFIVPAIVASCMFLPIVLLDIMRFSNRFAGPLLRLRKSLQMLADGEDVSELHFRPNDYLKDLSSHFNAINSRLKQLEKLNKDQVDENRPALRKKQLSSAGCSE